MGQDPHKLFELAEQHGCSASCFRCRAQFYISKYEMTQAQWRHLTGKNPSAFLSGEKHGKKLITSRNPVELVGWDDCAKLLHKIGLQLPTEAQWEYAARAGTHTSWPYGDSVEDLQGKANLADLTMRPYKPAWPYNRKLEDGHLVHAPVGSFLANPWGLFDVAGNVWEWCRDRHTSYRAPARERDGLRDDKASRKRVFRGGCFRSTARDVRSAKRQQTDPARRVNTIGLRPALSSTR